jgi:Bacterial PH domain
MPSRTKEGRVEINKERKKRKTFDLRDVPCPLVFDQVLILMGLRSFVLTDSCFCPIFLSLPEGHRAPNLIRASDATIAINLSDRRTFHSSWEARVSSYVEQDLISGERVLYQSGLHWIVPVGPSFVALVFGMAGLSMLMRGSRFAVFALLLIAGSAMLSGHVRRTATEMSVTNKRIVLKTGLLNRRTFELLLSKVESIGVEEGMLGRMLCYGSVVVRGTGGTPELFKNIDHPFEFKRQVQQQIEWNEITQPSIRFDVFTAAYGASRRPKCRIG